MNERINEAVDALLKKNVSGSSENSTLSIVYGRTSCGRPSSERVMKSNVNIAFIVSVADAKA
jgi:hypothetical protein